VRYHEKSSLDKTTYSVETNYISTHQAAISGLTANTEYLYEIYSTDKAGNLKKHDDPAYAFKTLTVS
jgi:hypothetical protein